MPTRRGPALNERASKGYNDGISLNDADCLKTLGIITLTLETEAAAVAESYRVNTRPALFVIGTFDQRVTVLSQQYRALNLAWALIESRQVPTEVDHSRIKVAIIGAGFAGLTFAAALLQKRVNCDITVFEERDTLLPLQQGSDTRWLHPHIYDWPDEGSEAGAAMLPILNWTAARASDVVVQVLTSWKEIVKASTRQPSVYCNVRHLQVSRCNAHPEKAQIEWVGELRSAEDGATSTEEPNARGQSETFETVIMAVGFGLEIDNISSYWRNETFGQPSLNQPRKTYLVSGQGDGAMIDVLRLRISQYRQDRILDELFDGKFELLTQLKKLRKEFVANEENYPLFRRFSELRSANDLVKQQFKNAIDGLNRRLRRDTEVILRLRVRNLAELLDARTSRTSFQNAFLIFLLYLCGGFAPTNENEKHLVERYGIAPEHVIRRHGTKRLEQLKRLLSEELFTAVETAKSADDPSALKQSTEIKWNGGYFGLPGRSVDAGAVPDSDRSSWRKEYLPGPTSILASSICGAVAGSIASLKPSVKHFRVTLHRTLMMQQEELLQQACEYAGRDIDGTRPTSGRTFPASAATIGLAYLCHQIVRSKQGIEAGRLQAVMAELNLDKASRKMSGDVGFVLAIPILQPNDRYYPPSPVVGIVYIDSRDSQFWLSDEAVQQITYIVQESIRATQRAGIAPFDRIRNSSLRDLICKVCEAKKIPSSVIGALEAVTGVPPPRTNDAFVLNLDHSDLTPVMVLSGLTEEPSPLGADHA